MRAAFKAVMDGKQVAFLAPTTVLAFQHQKTLTRSLRRLPGAHRDDQPLPHARPSRRQIIEDARRRQGRDRRRHPPAAVEGRAVPRPRPAGRGRGTALRRRAQGAHQADAQARRRADDDGDADPAHAEHVARRHPRHVDHRDAAEGSPGDPDQRPQVRPGGDPARDPDRARARRPGLLRPQPRRVDLLDGQPDHAAGAGGARRRRPRPDGRGRARAGDGRLRRAQVRRAAGDDDHRERPRHPERQHDHHQPRRIATACRSSISCAAASADRIGAPTPTC